MDRGEGRHRRAKAALAATVALAVACADDGGSLPALQCEVADSAGIQVAANSRPDLASRLEWRIGPEPVLTLGADPLGRDEAQQFRWITGAAKLPDGRIVVADGASGELRVFDADGSHSATWGGAGDGPGEFQGLTGVAPWPGDSIVAFDSYRPLRATVFSSAGEFGRSFGLPQLLPAGLPTVAGTLPGGTILLTSRSTAGHGRPQGLVRPAQAFGVVDPGGALHASLPQLPGIEQFSHLSDEMLYSWDLPLGRTAVGAVWGDLVVAATTDEYEIAAYRTDGSLARIVRRQHERRAPTRADFDAAVEAEIDRFTEGRDRGGWDRSAQALPMVEILPAFASVAGDALGYLWVEEYTLGVEEDPTPAASQAGVVWTVFNQQGCMAGLVETPPGLEIKEIGADYLLGVGSDEFDVPYVQVWPLARSP